MALHRKFPTISSTDPMCRNESASFFWLDLPTKYAKLKVTMAMRLRITAAFGSWAKKIDANANRAIHPEQPKPTRVRILWFRAERSNFARRDRRLASMSAFMISGVSIGWVGIGSPCACPCGYSTPDWRRVPADTTADESESLGVMPATCGSHHGKP